jgi:uncharacterized protein (TIGR03067 family)
MKWGMLAAAAVGLVLAVGTARAEEKGDVKKLEGTWKATAMEFEGTKAPEQAFKDATLTFKGDMVTHHQGAKDEKGTFKVDTSKKPWTIDVTPTEGEDKGKTMKGLISIEGDTLKIAFSMDQQTRPTAISSDKGSKTMVMTFPRDKK